MRAGVVNFKVQLENMTRTVHKIARLVYIESFVAPVQGEHNNFCSLASFFHSNVAQIKQFEANVFLQRSRKGIFTRPPMEHQK